MCGLKYRSTFHLNYSISNISENETILFPSRSRKLFFKLNSNKQFFFLGTENDRSGYTSVRARFLFVFRPHRWMPFRPTKSRVPKKISLGFKMLGGREGGLCIQSRTRFKKCLTCDEIWLGIIIETSVVSTPWRDFF